MIIDEYYINTNTSGAVNDSDLSLDEIETIVGRFAKHSSRAGELRGKIVILVDKSVEIHKCFGRGILWKG